MGEWHTGCCHASEYMDFLRDCLDVIWGWVSRVWMRGWGGDVWVLNFGFGFGFWERGDGCGIVCMVWMGVGIFVYVCRYVMYGVDRMVWGAVKAERRGENVLASILDGFLHR